MTAGLTKAEQYEKTRTTLLDIARELFAERGYAATSTSDIVDRAKVTRGALYYHFLDKEALFKAVFEQFRQTRTQALLARIQDAKGSIWERLVETGLSVAIESMSKEDAQRIIFTDGPSVLSPDIWHKNVPAMHFIVHGFEQLRAEGFIEDKVPCQALARLVWGALLEAGVYVAHADDPGGAQDEMLHGLQYWFGKLRIK